MLAPDKIGTNIVSLRKRAALTQLQLAEQLGVSRQAVSKWERGEGLPDIEQVVRLADEFHITIDALLRGKIDEHRLEPDLSEKGTTDPETTVEQASLPPSIEWEQVLELVKQRVSRPSFDTWFRHNRFEWTEGGIKVYCPNRFSEDWFSSRYKGLILQIVGELLPGSSMEVVVESPKKWMYRAGKTHQERELPH